MPESIDSDAAAAAAAALPLVGRGCIAAVGAQDACPCACECVTYYVDGSTGPRTGLARRAGTIGRYCSIQGNGTVKSLNPYVPATTSALR